MYYSTTSPERFETEITGPRVTSLKMRKDPPVNARILWPALGFPAVISPRDKPADNQMLDADATRCICVLILSNIQYLSKEDAARYLRYVQWNDRARRFIAAGQSGSFPLADIAVKNDLPWPKTDKPGAMKLTMQDGKDNLGANGGSGTGIAFGGNRDGDNSVVVKLSEYVRNFYAGTGLKYLHEIRISERMSGQLKDDRYHLFWNSDNQAENAPSPEMKLLIEKFAFPRRKALGAFWSRNGKFLMKEYEYEHGSLHQPYKKPGTRDIRTEILHPLFVQHAVSSTVKIGHLTDLHVSVRENVYEENLKKFNAKRSDKVMFNNWNRNFEKGYKSAKNDSDILLLTGDLIDYGRGHFGLDAVNQAGDNAFYQTDRNWFLFYYLLASGDTYQKPVYTILGNHDWRVNPYPPFAPGAPGFNSLFHNHTRYPAKQQRDEIIKNAHGRGHERTFSYQINATSKPQAAWQFLKSKVTNKDFWGLTPLATTIDSVKWYLLSINPFLDYSCTLPGGQKLLMLDWAEKEKIFFDAIMDGKAWAAPPWDKDATMPGPNAASQLTGLQKKMVENFVRSPGAAKIIGMHAPPIGPYSDWYDDEILKGIKTYDKGSFTRGPKMYKIKQPGGSFKFGHPMYAVLPYTDHAHYGTVADSGSFEKERSWFIKRVADPKSGVRVVLSGHIHRNGLYHIHTNSAKESSDPALTGKMLVKSLYIPGSQIKRIGLKAFRHEFPFYLNTTSLGPRGSFYTRKQTSAEAKMGGLSIDPGYAQVELSNAGVINQVEFRSIGVVAAPASSVSVPAKTPELRYEFWNELPAVL